MGAAPQPRLAFAVTMMSLVIPFVASAMTDVHATAVRCAAVRATPARNFALYERSILIHVALSIVVGLDIQSAGIGHPCDPVVAAALLAIAMGGSSASSAATFAAA